MKISKELFKKDWFVISATALVFTITSITTLTIVQQHDSALSQVQTELNNTKEQIRVLSEQAKQAEADRQSVASIVDLDRLANDKAIMEALFKKMFTWKSYDEYMQARKSVMADLKIPEDANSSFINTLLPALKDKVDGNGKHYNLIDTDGLNLQFELLTVYPVLVPYEKDRPAEYIGEVILSSETKTGGKGEARALVRFKLGKNGIPDGLTAELVD